MNKTTWMIILATVAGGRGLHAQGAAKATPARTPAAKGPRMRGRRQGIALEIRSFVENPYTPLAKRLALPLSGLSDASHTLRDDPTHGHARVGHGLILIGLSSILGPLPHIVEGLEASASFPDRSQGDERAGGEANRP